MTPFVLFLIGLALLVFGSLIFSMLSISAAAAEKE